MKVPGHKCPFCNKLIDALIDIEGEVSVVVEGNFCVCTKCGEILRFDKDIKSQLCTKNDMKEFKEQNLNAYLKTMEAQRYIKQKKTSNEWAK